MVVSAVSAARLPFLVSFRLITGTCLAFVLVARLFDLYYGFAGCCLWLQESPKLVSAAALFFNGGHCLCQSLLSGAECLNQRRLAGYIDHVVLHDRDVVDLPGFEP